MKVQLSPNYSLRGDNKISMIVVHGTGTMSDSSALDWISRKESKVSYHYLIAKDGEIYQLVKDEHKAWHAGKSSYNFREVGNSVNPISIGVALTGDGSQPYTDAQYEALGNLLADLMAKYRIPPTDVRGHNEVSPGRKTDPYHVFDWHRVLGIVGDR